MESSGFSTTLPTGEDRNFSSRSVDPFTTQTNDPSSISGPSSGQRRLLPTDNRGGGGAFALGKRLKCLKTTTPGGRFSDSSAINKSSVERSAKYSFNLDTPGLTTTDTERMRSDITGKSSILSTTGSNQRRGHNSLSTPSVPGRTPKTPKSIATPMNVNGSSIIAVVEGRGHAKGEIGLAAIDLKGFELALSQFSDGPTYAKILTKLQIIQPVEIIIPNTACENGNMTALFQVIREQFSYITLTTVQRKYFNETKGLEYINQLCVPEYNMVEMDVQTKYYCLATAAALLKYIEFIQNIVFAPSSLKITFKGGEQTTLIDASTAVNLELIQNALDPKSKHSLYGVLNHTKTAGGARLLRSNILQPPCDMSTIATRHDCVAELIKKEELFLNLQSVLGRFLDVDHLLSSIIQIPKNEGFKSFERKIAEVLYLKHTLELVDTLKESLKVGDNELFRAYHQILRNKNFNPQSILFIESLKLFDNKLFEHPISLYTTANSSHVPYEIYSLHDSHFDQITECIQTVVHDETRYQKGALNMKTQKLFAVKPGVNGLLDVARRAHCEVIDDITAMIKQVAETSGLPLTSTYNSTRGFYIQLSLHGQTHLVDNLPPYLIKVVRTKNMISCTTEDIIRYNTRLEESLEEIYFLSNVVISELMKSIRDQIGCLYKLAECVSMLDMLISFVHACTLSNYVQPEFTDTLAIKQGRHPILDKILVAEPPIANDIYAADGSNFVVITGPNMSGKSTYLRQIALLQIMAQCGSFVPADYASFRLTRQIFARIGNEDDLQSNCSTFKLEMKEMSYILQNITDESLLIIDELGRGTSIEEGVGIAYAISEELLAKKAFTFVATHFLEICGLEGCYPNVENYHLQVQREYNSERNVEKMTFSHILVKGRTPEKHYGLELAEISTLPSEIVQNAKEIIKELKDTRMTNHDRSRLTNREKATYRLAHRLIQTAKNSRLDREALKLYLHGLKRQYEADLEAGPEDGES